jgi:ornithine--oxo-acid transaminase
MAMAAGLATLHILDEECIIENVAAKGERLLSSFLKMQERYELIKDVRGKGLMMGIEFGAPKSFGLKMQWHALEAATTGLFCQTITIPLFKEHKILVQVAGHGSRTIKLQPPLIITDDDCTWIETAFEAAIAAAQKPGAVWSFGKSLVEHVARANAT